MVVALALLAESFGRDVWWLWSNRRGTQTAAATDADRRTDAPARPSEPDPVRPTRSHGPARGARVRKGVAVVLTILAALLVWAALVAPDQPSDLTLSAFFRIPLEGLVLIALAAVLPRTPRRILAVSCGLVLTLVVVLKVINYEMFTLYDRPYDPLGDTSQLGNGIETLRSLVGGTETKLIEVGAVVGTVVAGRRADAGDAAADPGCGRQPPLGAAGGRGARRRLGALLGARRAAHLPHADRLHAFRQPGRRRGQCASGGHPRPGACSPPQIKHDPIRNIPTNQLLTGLRGKDVLLVFVEAYGQQAVQGRRSRRRSTPPWPRGTSG